MVDLYASHGEFDRQTDVTLLHMLSGELPVVLLQFFVFFLRQFEEVIAVKVRSDATAHRSIHLHSWLIE